MLPCWFKLIACCFCYAEAGVDSLEPSYTWGKGLTIPQADLNLGGYLDAGVATKSSQKANWSLGALSIFTTWTPFNRLKIFSESQFNYVFTSNSSANVNSDFRQERLYADFFASETITLRLGKFLTPFGRWNVIHAPPLVWTSSRPLIINNPMTANYANGLMFTKRFDIDDHDLNLSIYLDDSSVLEPDKSALNFNKAAGYRLNYNLSDNFEIGTSFLAFQRKIDFSKASNESIGLDLLWKRSGFEILMEMIYRYRGEVYSHDKGLYIQTVAPLGFNVSLVGRYEYLNTEKGEYAQLQQHQSVIKFPGFLPVPIDNTGNYKGLITNVAVLGLAWRPYSPLVCKAEYLFGSHNQDNDPSGFFASLAMFF